MLEDEHSDWIFFLKENQKSLVNKPVKEELTADSLTKINEIVKTFRRLCKKQISLSNSILHQRTRLEQYKSVAKKKCREDYRFISESLKTSNRIHKQRLQNLQKNFDQLPNKANSILDLFYLLEWLIFSELKKSSNTQIIHQNSSSDSSSEYDLNLDLLTSEELDLLLGVSFTKS